MSTEDFNNFFCLRIVLFRCRLCLPSGWCVGCVSTLHDLPSSTHITGWQMLYEAGGCVLHWTLEDIRKTQRGAAPTDLLSTGTISLVWRVALGLAWMAGWLYKDLLRRYSFLYSHVSHFTIVILYILWNKTQNLCSLLETNTEVFKVNPGFRGNRSPFWLHFFLWFIPCLAVRTSISCFWHSFCIKTDIFM